MQAVVLTYESASLRLWIREDVAKVASVYSRQPRLGHASKLMEKLLEYADEHQLHLWLEVQQFSNSRGLNNQQLFDFYSRYGFVASEEKTQPIKMYRAPREKNMPYSEKIGI